MIPLLILAALALYYVGLTLRSLNRPLHDDRLWEMDQPSVQARGDDFRLSVGTDAILRTLTTEGQVEIGDGELRRVLGEEVS